MCKPARLPHLALALLAIASPACKRGTQPAAPVLAPQLALTPAAAARNDLVAEVVLPSADRTFKSVGALAKKLSLPFSADDLSRTLATQGQVPAGWIEKIDLTKPIAAVVVVVATKAAGDSGAAGPETAPVVAFALKDASKAGFDAFVKGAGKVTESSKDAVRVQPGDGGVGGDWLLARDGTVLVAQKLETLVAGGVLAIEARRALSQDVRVTIVPEGIARSQGTTMKDAIAKAKQGVADQQAAAAAMMGEKDPKMQSSMAKLIGSLSGAFLDAAGDTSEARINVSLDAEKGLATAFDVVPRPGSPFATTIAARKPYVLDTAILGGEAPGALWALGDTTIARKLFMAIRDPLLEMGVPEADRAKVSATFDAIFDALAGPSSGRFNFEGGPKLGFVYDLAYALKPGTDGKKLLADLETMMKAPWLGKLLDSATSGMMRIKLATKREADALVTSIAFDTKKLSKEMRAQMKALPFLDGKPIEIRTLVAGDRMLVSTGPGSKARLEALSATGGGPAPAGDLAAALAETNGEDGLYYADLAALFRPMIALAASGAMTKGGPNPQMAMASAMLQNARLATWSSYRGGEALTIGWRIPLSTFESVAGIVRQVTGMGGTPQ